MNRYNGLLNLDRKTLYVIVCILVVFIVSLTVAYAILSVTLNISGTAGVVASNWDVHFDDVKVISGSSGSVPSITSPSTVSFNANLSKPGDYYRFTVDVVNEGTIDAMIDSVIKTKDLTDDQKKFLKFDISYSDGVSIDTKQLLPANASKGITVEVMYRRDISINELQTSDIDINLEMSLIYVQASNDSVLVDAGSLSPSMLRIVSGDLYTIGSEVCVNNDCFYIFANDGETLKMLTKYNITITDSPRQSTTTGTIKFSSTRYWYNGTDLKESFGTGYPAYVYASNSLLYPYVNNYKIYLESLGLVINAARLISKVELDGLGCNRNNDSCTKALPFVYSTTYWSGTASTHSYIIAVKKNGDYVSNYITSAIGIRPVIEISLANI